MKVVCINDSDITRMAFADPFWYEDNSHLTKGKIYDVIYTETLKEPIGHFIELDNGEKDWRDVNRFITLKEYRKNIINKIINEI